MSKTTKKVSISDFERIANEQRHNDTTIDWNGVEVTVKYSLSLAEMLKFVQNIVDTCVVDGMFLPEVFDFAVQANILSLYANFKIPDNVEKAYDLVMTTDAVEFVSGEIDDVQLKSMVSSAREKIKYMRSATAGIRKQLKKLDELAVAVKGRLKKEFSEVLDAADPAELEELMTLLKDTPINEYIEKYLAAKNSADSETPALGVVDG